MNRRGWFGLLAALVLVPKPRRHKAEDWRHIYFSEPPIGRLKYNRYTISVKESTDMFPGRIGETRHKQVWLTHRNQKNAPHTSTEHLKGFASSRRKTMTTDFRSLPCGTCWVHAAEWITNE